MAATVNLEGREILRPLIQYQADLKCAVAQCGGRMCHTGISKMSSPPWYEHQCSGCKAKEDLRSIYPGVVSRLAPEAG